MSVDIRQVHWVMSRKLQLLGIQRIECTKRIYQVDYNDKVIGYWTLTDGEDLINTFIRELKQQKIEEIRIEMKNYGITTDDLKEVDK